MKQILFAALLLGSVAVLAAQSGVFEFTDSNGQCWRCAPGVPCERCSIPVAPQNGPPTPWPDTCPEPDCNNPDHRGWMFPSTNLRQYYQCDPNNGGWKINTVDCPCDTLFSFEEQRCLGPWEFIPHCRFDISDPWFPECNPTTTDLTTEVTTTEDPTNTTTTTAIETTSSAPCVCVIWWPCWCNPCMAIPRPPSCMMMG